jgi:flagellum-specific peptidoglycan hydrolase FlgJ
MNPFHADIIQAAQSAQRAYPCVFACVTLAQWAIESGYGREIPAGSNNFFGIKAVRGQAYVMAMTSEYLHGRWLRMSCAFAKYPTPAGSFLAHARLLATSGFYEAARHDADWKQFVVDMAKHYATAPNYAAVIIKEIEAYRLDEYNLCPEIRLVA